MDVQPHDHITRDYYTSALPTNISMFVKRDVKETLALNFAKDLSIEKELLSIGVITNDDDSKESKEYGKKNQASSSRTKERDYFDMESLTKSLKFLTNKVSECKR